MPCRANTSTFSKRPHPVPDAAGLRASQLMLERVEGLCADDLVLCLFSGGGSSLLPLPAAGLTLEHKQSVNRALLACGATIREMNCVRRHLSAIKGGRLAAACHPARVLTLLISDVPGDRPIDIASGPRSPIPRLRRMPWKSSGATVSIFRCPCVKYWKAAGASRSNRGILVSSVPPCA